MDTSNLAQHAGTAGAVFASIFVIATTTMKTMIPLRVLGIFTNLVLIATAIPARNYLIIVVQMLVLVVNSYRLHQMLQLVREVKKSVQGDLSMDWLKPFMTERPCATRQGAVLQGREGRGHALHRLGPLQAGRIRHFFALPPPIGRNPRPIVAFSPYIKSGLPSLR